MTQYYQINNPQGNELWGFLFIRFCNFKNISIKNQPMND
ncbi:hypothetical protein AO385_0216 [Moraxella catarrhalis]|uniref:Uncharacterized protein n=1 Tax=Moraxella catarrhalis TaxID=480 RepID=A0A198UKP6_MORCA|nr:hypothetical protein AO384_1170 [Moraxella catarrhalis]OAU97870.1 hypothetical protein AO383_0821 [Moraxella catarrhalis]OAV01029.1 hypothetical protein AO382_1006 [Moraxella catarrhalis]OAV04025.1 hypothetical protein AO385_0216 [Moraxella catarrhalis]